MIWRDGQRIYEEILDIIGIFDRPFEWCPVLVIVDSNDKSKQFCGEVSAELIVRPKARVLSTLRKVLTVWDTSWIRSG